MNQENVRPIVIGLTMAAALLGTSTPASAAMTANRPDFSPITRSDTAGCVMKYRPRPRLIVISAPIKVGPTITVSTDCKYTGNFTVHVETSGSLSVETLHSNVQSDTIDIDQWPIRDQLYVPGIYHLAHAVGSDYGDEHWSVDYGHAVTIKYSTAAQVNQAAIVGRGTIIAGITMQYSRVAHQLVLHKERCRVQLLNKAGQWITVSTVDSTANGRFDVVRIGKTTPTKYRVFIAPTSRLARGFSAAKAATRSTEQH